MVKKQVKMESDNFLTIDGAAEAVGEPKKVGGKGAKGFSFPDRGVVYLSHIPHGFYETEMKHFFSQFGHVTRLRLVRSDKSGNSKGYAFIEFRFQEIAQVVADTMNNYLMQNRVLKAMVIPYEKVTPGMFRNGRNFGPESCIGARKRRETIMIQNKPLTKEEVEIRCNRQKDHLLKLQEKLKAQGVDCLFQIEGDSNKRLFEGSDNSSPAVKKIKTSSKDVISSKSSKQSSTVVRPIKKPSIASKAQAPQKSLKKAVVEKVSKQASVKNDKKKIVKKSIEKKTVEKKPSVKKVVKKKAVVKSGLISKKEVSKKNISKKAGGK